MINYLLVMAGGAMGAALRYGVSRTLPHPHLPIATLVINIAGSFAMGLLAGWLLRQGGLGEPLRLLLGVGVLGGFTTFSAFSLEFVQLIERGALGIALGYAVASVILGAAALFLGLIMMRGAL